MPPSRSAFPASRLQSATGGVAAAKSPSSAEPKNRRSTLFKPHLPSRAEFEARSRHSERCGVQRPRAFRLLEHRYEIGEACRQRADRWGMRDAATAGNAAKNVPAAGVASRSHLAPGRWMPRTCDTDQAIGGRLPDFGAHPPGRSRRFQSRCCRRAAVFSPCPALALEQFPIQLARSIALDPCFNAFSSREPVSTSLENALSAAAHRAAAFTCRL